LLTALDRWALVREELGNLRAEIEALEGQLDGDDLPEKFEKAKSCLRILYRDQAYSSRSAGVNAVLDDPEVQGWIREQD